MAEAAGREELSRSQRLVDSPKRRCPACNAKYPLDFLVCPIDTTALEIHGVVTGDDPLIGEVVAGSFCVIGVLGSGGMGRVYEAQHVRLPRRFAVKVMHDVLARQSEAMVRFEREAQAAARVVNEHVLEVVDVVRTKDRRPCIVTELLSGESLGDVLDREKKLPLATAIAICRQVCHGLSAAHAAGVVHRDLKPSNLFLVKRPGNAIHVKIVDFGVAKLNDSELTRTGMVVGTPAFMAPEQARGSASVDARVDIYAVGALLYSMLTGRPPFTDEEQARILVRLLTEDPPRPRSIDRSIPEGIEALIQRAMARAPQDRPASVDELDRLISQFDERVRAEIVRISLPPGLAKEAAQGGVNEAHALELTGRMAANVTRRARYTRPATIGLAFLTIVINGAAAMTSGAVGLRVLAGSPKPLGVQDFMITGAIAAAVMLLLFVFILTVLIRRWRSVPSIERLRDGLTSSVRWLFGLLGLLAIGWIGASHMAPPAPAAWIGPIEFGIVVLPTLFALGAMLVGVRRAGRVA
jgi:tRNA A-37 threonylcarbamoyl transferase component Bud32